LYAGGGEGGPLGLAGLLEDEVDAAEEARQREIRVKKILNARKQAAPADAFEKHERAHEDIVKSTMGGIIRDPVDAQIVDRMMKMKGYSHSPPESEKKKEEDAKKARNGGAKKRNQQAEEELSSKPPTPTAASRAKFVSERSKRFMPPQAFGILAGKTAGSGGNQYDYEFDEHADVEKPKTPPLGRSALSSLTSEKGIGDFVSSLSSKNKQSSMKFSQSEKLRR